MNYFPLREGMLIFVLEFITIHATLFTMGFVENRPRGKSAATARSH